MNQEPPVLSSSHYPITEPNNFTWWLASGFNIYFNFIIQEIFKIILKTVKKIFSYITLYFTLQKKVWFIFDIHVWFIRLCTRIQSHNEGGNYGQIWRNGQQNPSQALQFSVFYIISKCENFLSHMKPITNFTHICIVYKNVFFL